MNMEDDLIEKLNKQERILRRLKAELSNDGYSRFLEFIRIEYQLMHANKIENAKVE